MQKLKYLTLSDLPFVVAGGAAYNYNLATDIDIFVLNSAQALSKATYDSIIAQQTINWLFTNGISEVKCKCGIDLGEYPSSSGIKAMHTLSGPALAKPIQLIFHTAPTVEALLDGFDITTHMVAMDAFGTITMGKYWTAKPLIHTMHDPTKTVQRLQKLRERYGYGPTGYSPTGEGEALDAPPKPLFPAEQFNKDYEKWMKHAQPLPMQAPFLAAKTGAGNLCFEANTDDE